MKILLIVVGLLNGGNWAWALLTKEEISNKDVCSLILCVFAFLTLQLVYGG